MHFASSVAHFALFVYLRMVRDHKREGGRRDMVFEKLRKMICDQLELDEEKITLETNLRDDLDADSLDLVDLVMSIEDEFEMEVPDEEIEKMKTVADVVKFIEENQ